MKNKKIIFGTILLIISVILIVFIGYREIKNYNLKKQEELKQKKYEEEKANFKAEITLIDKNTISYGEEINLKDYIKDSNVIFEDKKVIFHEFGEKEVTLEYKDKYDRNGIYSFKLNVVDDVKPIILSPSSVTAEVGKNKDLVDGVLCADYVSSKVKCEVVGDYNLNKIGEYKLKYKATDEAGNYITEDFTLKVVSKINNTPNNPKYISFKEIYNTHKTEKTMIGIDVSEWQGYIDFNKVKNAGAEFVIIRLGAFYDGKNHIDERYEENIKNAKKAGLKVGLYYYSEAKTKEEAISCAEFIKNNLHYEIDLPISYDWEDWYNYSWYNLSIYNFNKVAYAFLDKIESYGYKAMIYGSVNYMEYIWRPKDYDVWVAQYYKENQYNGKSKMWQITSSGLIDGISGNIDIDILYLD